MASVSERRARADLDDGWPAQLTICGGNSRRPLTSSLFWKGESQVHCNDSVKMR